MQYQICHLSCSWGRSETARLSFRPPDAVERDPCCMCMWNCLYVGCICRQLRDSSHDLQLIGTHAGRNDWSYRRNFSVSSSTITGFLFAGIENRTPAAATPYSEITQLVIMDETLVSWCFNHNPTKHGKTRRTRWQTDRLKSRDDNNANAARGITNGGKLDENENETTKHNLTKWRNLSFFPFLSHTFI